MKVSSFSELELLEYVITCLVMRGQIDRAREFAGDLALARDSRLTGDETLARFAR